MNIKLKRELDGDFAEVTVKDKATGEELVKEFGQGLPYRILAMKVNNDLQELTETVEEGDCVQLVDMRDRGANLVYQHSVVMIYLKAVNDILGDVRVDINNSLNKGLYTEIEMDRLPTDYEVEDIEYRMGQIVEADVPIVRKEEAEDGAFYEMDGFRRFFCGEMVPSAGYIEHFQLKKYHDGVILRFPYPTRPDRVPEYLDEEKLCRAFGESKNWHELLGVNYLSDLDRKVETGKFKEMALLSEALHEKKISDIADEITKGGKRIILIAGPSSSGKTTFARRLCIQLKVNGLEPLYLGTDDYFVERPDTPLDENGEKDYENLGAVDIALFNDQMNGLLHGHTVDLPEFDFIEGKKVFGKRITSIRDDQPIVIEGIHALNRELTKYIADEWKYRIYISPFVQVNIDAYNRIPTTDARLIRRMVRDHRDRGKDVRNTLREWPKVRAGEDKNIFPYNGEADTMFNSALAYELCILVKYVKPLLEQVTQEDEEYSEAKRLLRMLNMVASVENDHIVPNNSILKEFIGGSIFVEK